MIVTLVKFAHIATISIWAAGLICMPFLYRQRSGLDEDEGLHRMHSMVRFFYVVILSPSAFIAIGTGIALIFLQQTFDAWFTAKLFFVGLLVGVHVVSGLVILELFEEAGRYPRWRYIAVTTLTTAIATAILFMVSAKPRINVHGFFPDIFAPGKLGEMIGPLISGILS